MDEGKGKNQEIDLSDIVQIRPDVVTINKNKQAGHDIEQSFEKELIKDKQVDRELKVDFSNKTFYFIVGWCIGLFILIILKGLCFICLSDTIIIILITKTSVTIFSAYFFVLKGVFKAIK